MLGQNSVIFSGNAMGKINFGETGDKKTKACSFTLVCNKKGLLGGIVKTKAKINAYGVHFYEQVQKHLEKGTYVEVQGELMNRQGNYGDILEIRAHHLTFQNKPTKTETETEETTSVE